MIEVSVCVITYNQEKFIAKTLDSILQQKTNFKFEIVVGEDFSSDKTRSIVQSYINRYPEIVRFNGATKNLGIIPNLIFTLNNCKGEYIAICDGDDYWLGTQKLQMQFDTLELNHQFCMCVHKHIIQKGNKLIKIDLRENKNKKVLNIEDVLLKLSFHTSSFFFRSKYVRMLPKWYENVHGGDQFLTFCISKDGDGIYYIEDYMSVYNINLGSISHNSKAKSILDNTILHLKYFDSFSGYRYSTVIRKRILIETLLMSNFFENRRKIVPCVICVCRATNSIEFQK
ncbi:MAG: glycosyltransferase family 2 protein [Ferruginibacter sp.]